MTNKKKLDILTPLRDYISECPFLDEFAALNINYLADKVNTYSINESASYEPVLETDISGTEECQFQFTFDAKLHWNDEIANNIDNSKFFNNFKDWLKEKNDNCDFPLIEGIEIESIRANTNGYLYATEADEAIYRINCIMKYSREY